MKMRKELNNKGFSLVELLIATVILAIIVAPLLHSFVTSANTTVKSRQMGNVTLASENIAEVVEVASWRDLRSERTDADTYFAGATEKALYSYDGSTYTKTTYSAEDDCYYLGVKGIQAGSSTFNAMIKLDADEYGAGGEVNINDVDLADYSNMDAVYAQSRDADDPDSLGLASFQSNANDEYSDWWLPSGTQPVRTITLEVTERSNNKIYASVTFQYRYKFYYNVTETVNGVEEVNAYPAELSSDPIRYELLSQGFATDGNKVPNIYLMYYPIYGDDGEINDIIQIRNRIAKPFKLFLVKERGDDLSDELDYKATVAQFLPSTLGEGEGPAVIYSNIAEDLSDDLNDHPLSGVNYRIYSGNYFSSPGSFAGEHGDLVSKSEYNRMFEVTVQLFDADDPANAYTPADPADPADPAEPAEPAEPVADTAFTKPLHTFRFTKLQ